jgi:hypothetical protein
VYNNRTIVIVIVIIFVTSFGSSRHGHNAVEMPLEFEQFLAGKRKTYGISGFQGKLLAGFHTSWRRFKQEFARATIAVDNTIKVTRRGRDLGQENRVVRSMLL